MKNHRIMTLCLPFILLAVVTFSGAFEPEITFLDEKGISQLNADLLVDTYMDVLVEIEASRAFHLTSGFTPKDYRTFKSLLKYRMLLIKEAHTRGIEMPNFE